MRLQGTLLVFGFGLACFVSCGGDDSSTKGGGGKGGSGGASGGSSGKGTGGASGKGGTSGASGQGGKGAQGGTSSGGTAGGGDTGGVGGDEGGAAGAAASGGEGGGGELGPVTISGPKNLSTDALTRGRSCAEARAFSVSTLTARTAKLVASPEAGCLAVGDEVLLINLQGSPASHDNVGNWELLVVSTVTATDVGFTTSKVRFYGAAPGSDAGIGSAATDQKVALMRVPHFGSLTVADGGTLSAAAFDGALGGVLVLRADHLDVQGTIDASVLGYRSGRWSQDTEDCDDSLTTEAGESISGPGVPGTTRNVGGPGGLGPLDNVSFISNSPLNPSPGHAQPGEAGLNPNGRTLGEPGAAYGVNDATRLTMGSGASGNITCEIGVTVPRYVSVDYPGGGIVFLLADELTVGAAGSISATPPDAGRDVSSSGGYVYVRGTSIRVGSAQVTAQGSFGRGIAGPTLGQSNHASPGYIVLEGTTVTGTTDPPAHVID